jgi:hypothetical protein
MQMDRRLEKSLTCDWQRYEVVNYAMQQNFVPVVRRIIVHSHAETDLEQVTVRITAEPEIASTWTKTLDILPKGQAVDLGPVHLQLSGVYLASLTERVTGLLKLEVIQGDVMLYEENSPLTVLAYDQWGGLTVMPEMLAAFILPNHPIVARIVSEAAPYLQKWTGSPSFDAYQSRNPNRVRLQAAAIYSAIQAHQLTYCVSPASFEEVGQRVRLPDMVLGHHMGNCLDLSLLFAACLEAVGLHPLIIVTTGHSFPGVWLIEETFSEIVQDDITLLTKRLAAGVHELSISEATLLCAGHTSTYQESEATAQSNLADPDAFFGFIDVKRARASMIRPIPIRIPTPEGWEIVQEEPQQTISTEAPEVMRIHERPAEVDSISVTKQKQWERKLLDLSLRNTLLNFRLTKSALPLLNSQLGDLEDALSEGMELQLLPKPMDWVDSPRSADLFQSVSKDHPLAQLIRQEFQSRRIRADVNEKELLAKAIHLYRSARLSLEENGANTLYLALGLLKWFESNVSELQRYAPVVLIPVELVRKTSRAGFVLRIRDEEPQINITLLEMLRQDFGIQIGGLDPLPRDEKGIDLAGIFTTLRHAVMNMPRWDIVESSYLGLFSFSRFVMWNDIRSRADDLARNPVVSSLMAGRLTWEPGDPFPDPGQLDELHSPDQLPLPISADSSQITAVSAANNNHSFVLHGPPGTGKSQTITNMIASVLASGKTVLFVAEKMAALSVVQSRLEQIGLGPFCLELHSNKSTKKAVLEQLRKALEAARTASPEEWSRQADRLAASRRELNGYVSSLHKKYGFGASLYDAITNYGRVKSAPAVVTIEPSVAGAMTPERLSEWADLTNELRVAGEGCGHPAGNVWEDVACTDYTPTLKGQVEGLLAAYSARIPEVRSAYAEFAEWIVHSSGQPTQQELELLAELGRWLLKLPEAIPEDLLGTDSIAQALEQVERAVQHGQRRNGYHRTVTTKYTAEALSMEAELLLSEWRKAELKWLLPKFLKQNRIYKLLKGLALPGVVPPKGETADTLSQILQYQTEVKALKQLEPGITPLLGPLWNGEETDWDAVHTANEWIRQLNQPLSKLYPDKAQARQARERIAQLTASGRSAFVQKYGRSLTRYIDVVQELTQLEQQLASALSINLQDMDAKRGDSPWLDYRQCKVEGWTRQLGLLREWCSWRLARERAESAGLSSLVQAYERGGLSHTEVRPAFERAWWKAVIDYIVAEDKQLASFSGRLFEEKIRSFQETMERFERLTQQEIAARLSARIPSLHNQASSNSEAGILLRAIRSGGRGLSLRKLFEQIPNLLNRICPCVLMSPMSVAQYLDPAYAPFDLVVFDEASQLPTSEAVGAMARGRNVIVVGDPKQLPPTSFFTNTTSEDSDDAVIPEDLESILDDCLALGMPQEHLLWHYRSRHESLIAFSNRHFYENKLLTFPSPFERKSNVKWHPVDGFYDRGKSKQNRAEAEAVVSEIARRLRDPDLSRQSIGVVTFNSIQQTLIEDLLDEAFRNDAELEQAAAGLPESLFVKNLENVQGDERDVILFSIGYGPDATGKVSLNFGPLNREGGWRRLNVAVSRSRHEMHVFSTLKAEHLDVSRTHAEGVSALRAFLEYAEKGLSALMVHADQLGAEAYGIEAEIADRLGKEGYQADLHVGASGYRMDLAIVNPKHPETYLLAILCDGSSYKSGNTARDREVLRAQVLRQLGWRIHRVWSMDWLDNPERELQRIREAIQAAMSEETESRGPLIAPQPSEESAAPASVIHKEEKAAEIAMVQEAAPSRILSVTSRRAYMPYSLPAVKLAPEEFYHSTQSRVIRDQLAAVIQEEGPISRSLLSRRVLQAWGITRSGARIERHLDSLLASISVKKTSWDGVEYFWPNGTEPSEYDVFRVSEGEQERRNAEDLPPEEVANAVKEVLFHQISLPIEDLIRETVKWLGYARTGAALDKAVRNGLTEAIRRGAATEEQGRVYYKD